MNRITVLALAIVTILVLGVGTVLAQPPGGSSNDWDAMHRAPGMRTMHEQMPPELQAQCDVMHAQMGSGMGSMHSPRR